jgi:hypothetical protein
VQGDTVVVFRGQADFVDSTVVLHIGELAVDLEHNHWRMPEPTLLRVGPDGVTLPKFRFASEYGELTLRDLDSRGATMSGSLLLYRFDLGLVNPFLPDSMRINGGATAEVHLAGTSRQPLVQVTADIVDSRFDLASIDSLHVELEFGQGRLAIDRLWLASNYGRVRLAGTITHPGASLARFWPEAALDLTLGVEDGDWAFLDQFALPALDRLAGRYDTTLRITGTSDDPLITGDVASEPFHIHWLHLESHRAHRVAVDLRFAVGPRLAPGRPLPDAFLHTGEQ